METSDIASLLHDITSVNYHPKWLMWFAREPIFFGVFITFFALCIIITLIYAGRYYYRSDVCALRALRRLERQCMREEVNTVLLLDCLVSVIRKYLSSMCDVQVTAMAEEGLSRCVQDLPLSADAQKHANYIFQMLTQYRFGHAKYTVHHVNELISAVRSFVYISR